VFARRITSQLTQLKKIRHNIINVKKLHGLKIFFNGDKSYIAQLKQQKQKGAIT